MKKLIACLILVGIGTAAVAAHTIRNGKGWNGSVLSTGTNITVVAGAKRISVYNAGTQILYVAVNGDVTSLTNDIAGGVAFPIPASSSHAFGIEDYQQFNNISLATGNAAHTNTVYVGAY